jgi:hypothetical protein
MNFVVDGSRISHRSRDFLSQYFAISFSQTMDQSLYPAEADLKLVGNVLV